MPKTKAKFPYRIGQYVMLKTDLLKRTIQEYPEGKHPLSKFAGVEGKIIAMAPSEGEVNIKGIGWTGIGDLANEEDIAWEEEDDPILVDEEDDEILEDDSDDEIIEDDDDDDEIIDD